MSAQIPFSQRIGQKPIKETIQAEGMDKDLRTGLWNAFHATYIATRRVKFLFQSVGRRHFYEGLWRDFFKRPMDELEQSLAQNERAIRKWFFECEWYEVYDFVEYLLNESALGELVNDFRARCNQVLEKELSAYRLVGAEVVRITDENELRAIEEALVRSRESKFAGVREHLQTAAALAFDRKSPDFRNSIKESISAVEAAAKEVCGDRKATLGQALVLLENKGILHPALRKAFSALYGYTSDANGIRHAILELPKCGLDEAKYMLVVCSAFVGFLTAKGLADD